MAVNTWIAAGAGQASNGANWSLGRAPLAGDQVTWDNTSDNNCSWDIGALTVTVDGWVIATGYDGTVTQAATAAIGIGALGLTMAGGTLTGNTNKKVISAGSVVKTGGTATAFATNLEMTGADKTLSIPAFTLNALTFKDNTNVTGNTASTSITIASGKTVAISNGVTLTLSNGVFSNGGTVNGPGTFTISFWSTHMTYIVGVVNAPTVISQGGGGNTIMTLGGNAVFGSSLTIQSGHATFTMTVEMNGKSLSCSSLTVSTRGVLTNSGAEADCTVSGALTLSGVGASVSGSIRLDVGSYVQSDGAATPQKMTVRGDFTRTGGTINGASMELTFTAGIHSYTRGASYFILKLVNNGTVNLASNMNFLTVENYGTINIASYVLDTYVQTEGTPVKNKGNVTGSTGFWQIYSRTKDVQLDLGTVNCEVRLSAMDTATGNRQFSLASAVVGGKLVSVSSASATYTFTLDTAGFALQHKGLTVGNRGAVLFKGSKVLAYGNLDTSAGSADFGTSQYVQAAAGTIKTAANQPFNDLIVRSGAAGSSRLSDIVINGIYAHVPPTSSSAFAITFDPLKEYTGKRRPLRKQLRKAIVWPSLADKMLLEDLEVPA